ncbi:hypothetical protein KP78_28220 [Jeotgalibacillus soli]|uniref:Uncharacterized protein n=1 Tax=Jeotgalibacillus soli TaxID=889306 RepID=A0A0C2VMP7_9BACL|nr:hypothetical protein KP78_28220 [Jeotgalibacillus soli]
MEIYFYYRLGNGQQKEKMLINDLSHVYRTNKGGLLRL